MAKKLFNSANAAAPAAQDAQILPLKGSYSMSKWLGRIKTAQKNIDDVQPQWDANQRRYLNKKREYQQDDEMLVPSLFVRTEEKKAWLMPSTPKVVVAGKRPDSVPVAPLVEAMLNDVLTETASSPKGVDAMTALDEVMPDALVGAGIFAVNIGYENVIDGMKTIGDDGSLGMQPDPNWQAPDPATLMPGMPPPQPPMVPITMEVPNIVWENYFMNRVSPSKLLIPSDFTGSDYDKGAWLGFEFLLDENISRQKWTSIPEEFKQYADEDDRLINAHDREHTNSNDRRNQFRFYFIVYRTNTFDDTEKNPFKQRFLVILDGHKKPVEHRDSPYQWVEKDGSLGGMMGFPIHIGALRYVSDSAFPPSDATMSRYQDEEITDGRNDMKLQRKRNVPMRIGNVTRLKQSGIDRIERAPYGAIIPVDETAFGKDGLPPIKDVQTFAYPQENFNFDVINQRDMDAVYGSGGAAGGGQVGSGQSSASATMSKTAESHAASRREREQAKFLRWYAGAVNKLFPLYQRFMTETQYSTMLGPDGEQLAAWNKDAIQGQFGISVIPKASAAAAEVRQDELNWYNNVAKSPNVNLRNLDIELAKSFGKDPAKIINPVTPPPPPPPALPHGISLNLDEKGLNPLGPAFPIIIALLKASGVNISDQTIAQAQQQAAKTGIEPADAGNVSHGQVPPAQPTGQPGPAGAPPQHGGAMPTADVVNKNFADDNPGGMPGRTA